MKKIIILGAGTAGTMMLNKFNNVLDKKEWHITIVDQGETHYYQPGFSSSLSAFMTGKTL
jgi:sulfide:quinone oxidoreductase